MNTTSPINVTYIISNVNKALSFEWIATDMDKAKVNLSFILLNPADSELEQYLQAAHIPVVRVPYYGKKSLGAAIWKVYRQLKDLEN